MPTSSPATATPKSDQEIELVCTIVGRVELVGNDMQLVIDREQSTLPFGISGNEINKLENNSEVYVFLVLFKMSIV